MLSVLSNKTNLILGFSSPLTLRIVKEKRQDPLQVSDF